MISQTMDKFSDLLEIASMAVYAPSREMVLAGLALLGGLGVILAVSGLRRPATIWGYQAGPPLMSAAELKAFRWLVKEVGAAGHICPKVRLADLVQVRSTALLTVTDERAALNRIAQKHLDFVVIDWTGRVSFAVEVDDSSHDRRERRARDVFVNEVCQMGGLPLVRVKPNRLHESVVLRRRIETIGETYS